MSLQVGRKARRSVSASAAGRSRTLLNSPDPRGKRRESAHSFQDGWETSSDSNERRILGRRNAGSDLGFPVPSRRSLPERGAGCVSAAADPPPSRYQNRARTRIPAHSPANPRSEEHTSELQSPCNLVCRLLLEKKKKII